MQCCGVCSNTEEIIKTHFDEEECTDEEIQGLIDGLYRKKSEFNYNVAEMLEDYSAYSKQIGIDKFRRKWISTENKFLEKEKTEMSDWYWSPEETQKFYKSLNTLVNGGSVILKNLKAKILENEGVDENEGKFCTFMIYRLMNNMMAKTCSHSERLEEIKDGDFGKIVNSYREKTKSDDDNEMEKVNQQI